MMTPTAVDTRLEDPVFFAAGDQTLFGIVTSPAAGANGVGIVTLSGGGATAPATNRNRLSVNLHRRLAADGYAAIRFDYHGIGESTGVLAGAPRVSEPYLDDVDGAARALRERGIDRFALIGFCFGGATALQYAPTFEGLEAVVLVSPPLRDVGLLEAAGTRLALQLGAGESFRRAIRLRTIKGIFHPARRRAYVSFVKVKLRRVLRRTQRRVSGGPLVDDAWVGKHFLEPIGQIARRGIPLLFIYGTEDHHYHDFELARAGRLGKVLEKAPRTEVVVVDGWVHGLTSVEVQRRVADITFDWLGHHVAGGPLTTIERNAT